MLKQFFIIVLLLIGYISPQIVISSPSKISFDKPYRETTSFDFVNHKNNYIKSPHATFPAILLQDGIIHLQLLKPVGELFTVAIGKKGEKTLTVVAEDLSGEGVDFELSLPLGLPIGTYDLVLLTGNTQIVDAQAHSVHIVEAKDLPLTIAHVSDTHLPMFIEGKSTLENVTKVFQKIESTGVDFVIITGDFLEGGVTYFTNETTGKPPKYTFEQVINIGLDFLDMWNFPIFLVSGNHDWMNLYPTRKHSSNIWKQYMYPENIIDFEWNEFYFVGYNSNITGIDYGYLNQISERLQNGHGKRKILFAHYDYDQKIRNNVVSLNISLFLYGHDHVSKVEYVGNSLWVEMYNSFEPGKYDPLNGFRTIVFESPDKILVDGIHYETTKEKQETVSETTSQKTYLEYLLVGVWIMVIYRKKKNEF